jgi:hypothetical protein
MGGCRIAIYFLIQQHSIRSVVFHTGEYFSLSDLHFQCAPCFLGNDFNQPFFTVLVLMNT